jgi:membrane protein implicated in regulation of membrane protease activity
LGAAVLFLYIFALAAGIPLLLVFAFGGELGADTDTGSDGGFFSWVSISAVSFGAVFFGVAGMFTVWASLGAVPGVLIAAGAGILGASFHNALFGWMRRSEASSEVTNLDLVGGNAIVVLDVSSDNRGQVVVDAAGARHRITASPATRDDRLEQGERVEIVGMEGGVALVARSE